MFTGIVQCLAKVVTVQTQGPGAQILLNAPEIAAEATIGDSVAVNGCCLTVVTLGDDRLGFDAGEETLSRTNLGELQLGDLVNVESSVKVGDPLGGHFVTGHIDGVGTIDERLDDGEWSTVWISAPRELLNQMASKGSVAVDGVSLTLVEVTDERFSVALIPHTLEVTTLGQRKLGDCVNLETDVLAKYVQRQLEAQR